ncbi:MAG: MBOAT family protein [Flavobacteriales bacterium]|nr:MBOAT family protein [Flavobacteriales bacterium]
MLFNSIEFALFFPLVFVLYWFVTQRWLRVQNAMLLVASYFFYGCWDWRFLFLLAFSTFLDYYTGIRIHDASSPRWKRIWLVISVTVNLGFLGFFKYYNFFAESFAELTRTFGLETHPLILSVVLPVGISFYTFHGLSYVFDIYYRRIEPHRDPVNYALFVSFFPLLVAGPIERATHLLPQLEKPRTFDKAKAADGLRQILWGLFKKVVIADTCAGHVNVIFDNPEQYSGITLLVGAVLFAFQIYGDFSGYSDIALGSARLLGIELLQNFSFPYFSRDIAEFWRRWHISLSSWFRDYLYIPLGGSKGGTWMRVRNTFIIFLVSGFWHGANWTFIAWGALNAIYFLPLLLSGRNRTHMGTVAEGRLLPSVKEAFQMLVTFGATVIAWVFFRAEDMHSAFAYLGGLLRGLPSPGAYISAYRFVVNTVGPALVLLILFFLVVEWLGRHQRFALAGWPGRVPTSMRWTFYYAVAACILYYSGQEQQFIYFQF